LRRTPGSRPLYEWTASPTYALTNNFTTYTTADSLAYYIYLSNYASTAQVTSEPLHSSVTSGFSGTTIVMMMMMMMMIDDDRP
jgi:hypothetical protein